MLYFFYPKGNIDEKEIMGLIISSNKNSYILLTLKGKYYVYDKNNAYNQFSILKLTGYSSNLSFSHYESSFDYKEYLFSKGINYQFNIKNKEEIFINKNSMDFLYRYAGKFLNSESYSLFLSFIKNENLKTSSFYYFNELGINNYLSLSGFHISFFISFISLFFKNKNRRKYANCLKLILVSIFLIFSSFSYSLRRLFIQSFLSIIINKSKKLKNKINKLDRVAITGFILLIFEPYSIKSASFYFAFPFLFYISLFPFKIDTIKDKFKFTLKTILFFLPYTFISKGYVSIVSILIQIILIPFTHILFIISISLFIIPYLGFVLNYLLNFLFLITQMLYKYTYTISVENYKIILICLYYIIYIFISFLKTYNFVKIANISMCLYLIPISYYFVNSFIFQNEIIFIDVDQGDSTLLRYKNKNILFDTGGKQNVDLAKESLIPFFKKKNIKKIDYVLITHLDYDHYGALNSLNTFFEIDNIIYGSDFLNFKDNSLTIDDLTITNLNKYKISEDSNDNSAVFYFECFDKKILIQGDAPKKIEELIIKDNPNLKADIIKLGHHGSKTSSSKKYLSSLSVELAIISVGEKNSYYLPSKETLSILNELNINYLRTDYCSTITLKF